jgi:hypothetical protein
MAKMLNVNKMPFLFGDFTESQGHGTKIRILIFMGPLTNNILISH